MISKSFFIYHIIGFFHVNVYHSYFLVVIIKFFFNIDQFYFSASAC